MWEKINIMEGTILPYETFMDDAYLSTFSLWGAWGHSDTYVFSCEPARLCACVKHLTYSFFLSPTAIVFPSSSSDLESTGTDAFNGSEVLARILGLEKVISLHFVMNW